MEDGVVAAAKTARRPPGFLLPLLISHLILMFIMFMIYATCICMQQKKKKGKEITRAKEENQRLSKEEKDVDDALPFSFYKE